MSEEEKPKLGLRPKLGVKRTTEVTQVKQSFSHGRTRKVVVETRKARAIRKPRAAAVDAVAVEDAAETVAAPASDTAAPPRPEPEARVSESAAPKQPAMPVAPPPPFVVVTDDSVPNVAIEKTEAAAADAAAPTAEAPPAAEAAPDAAPAATPGENSPQPAAIEAEAPTEPIAPPPAAPEAPEAQAEAGSQSTPAAAEPATVAPAKTPEREAAPAKADSPAPARAKKPALTATQKALLDPKLTRRERQQLLLRHAEEERLQLAEEARIRERKAKAEEEEAERQRLEEKARAEEEEARREAAAAKQAAEAAARIEEAEGRHRESPSRQDEDSNERSSRSGGRNERRRRKGKLSIEGSFGEDGRTRSMAAMQRARQRSKGNAHGGGSGAKTKTPREIQIPEAITVQELANRMAERGVALVKLLFNMGMATTINSTIDQDTAELLVTEFGHTPKRVSDSDIEQGITGEPDKPEDLQPRPPVVTIMGHVDHGKTSLLDALRGTGIASGEAGGITQHIGAYQVTLKSGSKISFLDTPGHEAFSDMRSRGANATDIAILVVAADDGIKQQTIEAINHIKAANVPMIVAINKIDKPQADAQRVRTELLQYDVQVEAMGGEVQDVEVSATQKTGLDELTEKILLQAEIMELKANPDRMAEAIIIEAKLDKGRGPVATALVRFGTLRNGDIFVAGTESGKVRALVDDRGRNIAAAPPSMPVEVLGLSGVPEAGDILSVVESEARAREIAAYRRQVALTKRTTAAPASLESMFANIAENRAMEFPVIVKADVHGSTEAIVSALNKLSTDEIKVRVLHSGVGAITESDVTLARASGAVVFGFNVRANAKARQAANQAEVPLKYYDVIYNLIDEVKAGMAGKLGPEYFENVVGRAEIREVFHASKFGKAAGCLVTEGFIRRNLKARVLRDDVIIYNGSIASLRRFKDDVTEVQHGYECGIGLENFQDIEVGDMIETFEVEERLREL